MSLKRSFQTLIFLMMSTASLHAGSQAVVFDFGGVMTCEPIPDTVGVVLELLCTSFQLKPIIKEAIGINAEMYVIVDELKEKGISVALMSNIDTRIAKFFRELGLYEPFNPCLLSCEMGVEKPNTKAYEILLEHFDLSADEIVFIDDKSVNVEAAKKLGLDAILFQSSSQIRQELKARCLL